MPLIVESMRLWDGMNERTGRETGFRVTGIAYTAEKEEQMALYAEWIKIASEHGIETQLLNTEQAAALAPGVNRHLAGGMITPLDGRAEPQKLFRHLQQKHKRMVLSSCKIVRCAVSRRPMVG